MIAKIIEWSARHVAAVLFATVVVVAAGCYALVRTPLDALPDLSDVQVIVYTEYAGQGPQVVEDQVTYPLTTAMLSVPRARVVRGFSNFGVSFVGKLAIFPKTTVITTLDMIGCTKNQTGPRTVCLCWVTRSRRTN